jgi:hypothetical protein
LIQRYTLAVVNYALIDGTTSRLNLRQRSIWISADHECNLKAVYCTNDKQKADILDAKQGLDPDDAIDQTFVGSPLFIGSIPAEIGGLTDLAEIFMEGQGLSGSIPSSLYTLPALQQIDLPSNSLIPSELFEMRDIRYLDLGSNMFSGTIPESLARTTGMLEFTLSNNSLTGSLPSGSFATLATTLNVDVSNYMLTGTL